MAVRWKKYHSACKGKRVEGDRYGKVIQGGVSCNGKRGKYCPEDVPSPCGGWSIEFRDQHGTWRSIVKPGFTKTEAKEAYQEIVRNVQRGLFDLPILQKMPKVTVEAYSRKYLEYIKGSVPENTFVNRQTAVNAIAKHLGGFEVSKLNAVLIQRFCTDIVQKDGAKASTVNQYCSVLRLILDMAVQERVVNSNPMQGVKRLKVDETRKRILTNEEIKRILDESVLPMGRERMAILIGMFTGLRLMDVMALKWSNIDFQNATLTTIAQKTGRVVALPLSSYLVGELKKYKESAGDAKEHLFYDGEVNHKIAGECSNHFIRVFKKMGLSGVSFHLLRHTNATLITEVVQDVSVASKMLGHTNLNTTMTYVHRDLDDKKETVEKFTKHVLSLKEYELRTIYKTA